MEGSFEMKVDKVEVQRYGYFLAAILFVAPFLYVPLLLYVRCY